jgi:hypothetical protein
MLIVYRDGLLLTEISFHFNGRMKVIKNIVIDTGTSHTLISQDEVDDIGIKVTLEAGTPVTRCSGLICLLTEYWELEHALGLKGSCKYLHEASDDSVLILDTLYTCQS